MAAEYVELVIAGNAKFLKGLLWGRYPHKHNEPTFFINSDYNIYTKGLLQQIQEQIGIKEQLTHVIVRKDLLEDIQTILKQTERVLHLSIKNSLKIRAAQVQFKFSAFKREDADRLLDLVQKQMPPGVDLLVYDQQEPMLEPDAKGVEEYAPLHAYELHAQGTYYGDTGQLILFAWKLFHESLISLDKIELEYETSGSSNE